MVKKTVFVSFKNKDAIQIENIEESYLSSLNEGEGEGYYRFLRDPVADTMVCKETYLVPFKSVNFFKITLTDITKEDIKNFKDEDIEEKKEFEKKNNNGIEHII